MSVSWVQYLLYLQYMAIGLVMVCLFAASYLHITPVRELYLIKRGNLACALSFGGALLGFCLPLASSIAHSLSIPDFMLWGCAAAVIQIAVYFAAVALMRGEAAVELENNNVAVGSFFGMLSLAVGLLNAACLT